MVHGSNESYDGDEQQEHTHCYDPTDDVDAGHQAEAFAPRCDRDQQEPDQLEAAEETKLPTAGCSGTHRTDQSPSHNMEPPS